MAKSHQQDGHEPLILFAKGADGSIRDITEVPRGLECNCTCFACQNPLIARKGTIRQWHFAHASQESVACEWAAETALHFVMKEIIEKERRIFLPDLNVSVERATSSGFLVKRSQKLIGELVPLEAVMLEHSVHPIRPDVVAVSGGRRLFLEIIVTHGVDSMKQQHIRQIGASAIEFDLRKQDRIVDRDMLRELLLRPSNLKKWIFHRREAEIEAKLLEEVNAEIAKLEVANALRRGPQNGGESLAAKEKADANWLAKHHEAIAKLVGKMQITGKALCFCLNEGGAIFVHSHHKDVVLLDVTSDADWLLPTLAKFSAGQIPESTIWGMPKKLERQLLIFLNSISTSIRSVESHTF